MMTRMRMRSNKKSIRVKQFHWKSVAHMYTLAWVPFSLLKKEICILCKYLFKRICSFHMIWMILTNKIATAVIASTRHTTSWKIKPYHPLYFLRKDLIAQVAANTIIRFSLLFFPDLLKHIHTITPIVFHFLHFICNNIMFACFHVHRPK